VFWGITPGSYTSWHDVGSALTFVIPNAVGGQRYFIAVSAYNALGVVGPPSSEVSAIFPTATAPLDPTATAPFGPTAPTAPTAPIDAASSEDHTPPTVVITVPTTQRQHHTLDSAVMIGGTASDDTGISSIRWQNSRGGEGRATGTDAWIASIPLHSGSNAVSITAIDLAGNSANRKITIYRRSE
jgi:hypothetical protein